MAQLAMVLLSGAVLLGMVAWGQRPGHEVPTWLYLLAAAPLMWMRLFGGRRAETSPARQGVGVLYLIGAGLFLMAVGGVARAIGGGWGEVLGMAAPMGAGAFVAGLLALVLGIGRR